MSSVVERFLRYVRIDTQSNPHSMSFPSAEKELNLAAVLARELEELGLRDVSVDANGYVMGKLPSNLDRAVPAVGLIAHMDTSPELSGAGVSPQVIQGYDGGDIVLNAEKNIILSPRDFPELRDYIGQGLITTDGTTLLGADDKAGVAEIMAALDELARHPERPHGALCIGFTPDEEIGRGADRFDLARFGADLAYTIDGGEIGEINYENFNAAKARIYLKGRNIHTGEAKGKMIHAAEIAVELDRMLPDGERPQQTEGYEGFYHLDHIEGGVEQAELSYIIRDHDRDKFEARKKRMTGVIAEINRRYGANTARLEMSDQYYNMREKLSPEMP
ncbi:MAG TPA: peptidase T, partial [Candidatus Acidoferrum sp.]|nr:peptidase T [Candidatus Acidoferrum sp.]